MIIIPLIANKKLLDTINIPVTNPPVSNGLTLIPVTKKTKGVKSKIINPAQILFFLFLPETLKAIRFVTPNKSRIMKRNRISI